VVVCGNLIERFDHPMAMRILDLPDPDHRDLTLRLMRRYVRPTPADAATFREAMTGAYAAALGLRPRTGQLAVGERAALTAVDARFVGDDWLAGPHRPPPEGGLARRVKIRAGVWTFAAAVPQARVVAGVVGGRIESARLRSAELNGLTRSVERSLVGVPLADVAGVLSRFGAAGDRISAAFALADTRGL
jgi:hypothetical protein